MWSDREGYPSTVVPHTLHSVDSLVIKQSSAITGSEKVSETNIAPLSRLPPHSSAPESISPLF